MRGRGPAPLPKRESLSDHIGKLGTAAALAAGIYYAGKHHAKISSGINTARLKVRGWTDRTTKYVSGGTDSTGPYDGLQSHGTAA